MCEVLFFSISSPGKLFYLFNSSAPALSFHLSLSFSFLHMSDTAAFGSWGFSTVILCQVCVCVCVCVTAWKADNLQTN